MKTNTSHLISNEFRSVNHDGREFYVVPGVPVRAQVMNDYLAMPEEIIHSLVGWNGTPITIHHPKANGGSVKTPAPDVAVIGNFYNAAWDPKGSRMVGEYWIDVAKASNYAEGVNILEVIKNGGVLETSTGYFADDEMNPGTQDGRHYKTIHRNWIPDHIAILPDQIGACSVKDGCGVNRNVKQNCGGECDCPFKAEMIVNKKMPDYVDGNLPASMLLPFSFDKGNRTQEQLNAMREYIRTNGIDKPVIIMLCEDSDNLKIVDGNHRVAMANELGIEQVPVEIYDEEMQMIDPKIVYAKQLHEEDQGFLMSQNKDEDMVTQDEEPGGQKEILFVVKNVHSRDTRPALKKTVLV
jgi:hypothetical protein